MKDFFVNDKLLVWPKKEKNKTYTEQQVNEILKKNGCIINGIDRNFFHQHHLLYSQIKKGYQKI